MVRTSPQKKAKQLAKLLRNERADYQYLKAVFRHLRAELDVPVDAKPKKLPEIPTEDELKRYYEAVWSERDTQDLLIVKTLLYTGARVSELVNMQLHNVDFRRCQIRIDSGKGDKDRIVPFPDGFKELLAIHVKAMKKRVLRICSNLPGKSATPTAVFARYWRSILKQPASTKQFRRISCDTFFSPGSKSKG